jgi:hypothetical protein
MESQLPAFSFNIQVTAQSGRQDKLEILLPWGTLDGTQGSIDAVRGALGSPVKASRERLTSSDLQDGGWIFNRPQQTRTARKKMTIRQRPCLLSESEILAVPLFSGGLSFSNYYRGNPNAETSARLRLSLALNPTRFARHQRPCFSLDGLAMIEPPRLLFRQRALRASFRGEFSLDERDNWIPDSQRYGHFFCPAVWPRLVRNYIAGTLEVISAEMERACIARGVEWNESFEASLSLPYAETYWEFSAPDPLKVVTLCESLLRRFTENPTRKRFFKTFAEGTVMHNSRSLSVDVRTGVQLVIYAKTNRRVRVEVRHRLGECADVLGGSYRASSVREVCRMLRTLRQDGAAIVNTAFQFMRGQKTFPKDSVSVGQLLFEMVQAVGRWESAGTLLSMLMENGKIVTDTNLKPHVHALRDAGIITAQRRNRQRCYIIADRYKRALEVLSTASKPLLDVRQRQRISSENRT